MAKPEPKPAPPQESLAELRAEIAKAKKKLRAPQSFSAQVIAYSLKEIAERFGKAEANKAIRELGLVRCGWKEEP